MFAFAPPRRPRRPSLTPMIDVVFLLLVFFMIAARFGPEAGLTIQPASGGAAAWQGPPRLVEVGAGGLRLNGVPLEGPALIAQLSRLTQAPGDPIVVRADTGTALQVLVDALDVLSDAGFTGLMLVE
ncbi:MAG: biopolymer transporter ExbD [Rhodobacteraceae bacterium]|nr:biopolymer transporter ExbD [Paracoccaceae bacterium]